MSHPIDRSVSARKLEIVAAQTAIEAAAKPRALRHRDGLVSLYHELSYPNQALQNHLGGGSHRELWWHELEQDLGRIDQASLDQG